MERNLTILIIEDDHNDVLLLKSALKRENINNPIQVVHDGQEGIDYLQGEGKFHDRDKYPFPSVIFTDLKMPRLSGFDVLTWLKSHPDCFVLPVIVLSASKLDEDIKKAYQMGANAYMVKPSQIEELQEMIKTAYKFWAYCEKPRMPVKC